MPDYTVRDPRTGRSITMRGPQPPTGDQIRRAFAQLPQAAAPPQMPAGAVDPNMAAPSRVTDQAPAPATSLMRPDVAGLRASIQGGRANITDIARTIDEGERDRITHNANAAPMVGGLVGGIVGGIPGAAIGGAVGETTRQVALRSQGAAGAPEAPLDQARQIVTQGATQGALQGAGQGIAVVAGKLAPWLMNRATSRVTARLARDFPELSDTLIDHALTVSKGGESKARHLLKLAKGRATTALTTAEQAGSTVPVQLTPELAESLRTAVIESAMKTGRAGAQAGQPLTVATARLDAPTQALIASVDDALAAGAPIELTPTIADLFKTQLQRESRALYASMRGPNGMPAVTESAAVRAEYASRLNDALDLVASGYKAANAEAQTMIGASRGIQQSIRPSGNLYQAMVRPAVGAALGGEAGRRNGGTAGAIAGAVTGAALTSPAGMSIAAITLRNPLLQSLLRQMPRATAAALTALLAEEGTPQPAHLPGEPQ